MVQIYKGSPSFKLWLSDAWPILRAALLAGAGAFLAAATGPLIDLTVNHWPSLTLLAGFASAGLVALQRYLADHSKGKS